jgi:F subunit of K+-transporting ATPase (Potass_KdpF)
VGGLEILGGMVAALIVVYLGVALLKPDVFS